MSRDLKIGDRVQMSIHLEENYMSEFEQLPQEHPACWLSRLAKIERSLLPLEQRRVHAYYLADARRLLQEERQKAKWKQGI